MQATLIFYIVAGCLIVLPLILFNIKRVFVKEPTGQTKVNVVRGIVISLLSVLIVLFLVSAYFATIHGRYEIATESIATEHAELLVGAQNREAFCAFVEENGTVNVRRSLDALDFEAMPSGTTAKFQISDRCIPRYWVGAEGFDQSVSRIDSENPIYVMYMMDCAGKQTYYAVRMINTDDGWKYDWIGEATQGQIDTIPMSKAVDSKWYTVEE